MKCLDTDICKGCVYDDGNPQNKCTIYKNNKNKECPCINCLVKCICRDQCPAYIKLMNKIFDRKKVKNE